VVVRRDPAYLVFVTGAWARRRVLDEPLSYHPFGVPRTAYPRADAAVLGIDLSARPSFAEAMSARADRMALIRGLVDGLTDSELERPCTQTPAPGYPEETRTVGSRLEVVMGEECEFELERPCTQTPAPGYPEETRTVGSRLEVVMGEECEHLRFAVRDPATLEAAG
jgi:hypothetical protein